MAFRIRVPKSRRGKLGAIAGSLLSVALAGFAFIYFVLFPTSSPPPFRLSAPKTVVALSSASASPGTGRSPRARRPATGCARSSRSFQRSATRSGGRLRSRAARPSPTPRGASAITAASFVTNVYSLKSNESLRDQHIHTIGIQSATYPKATFVLTARSRFRAARRAAPASPQGDRQAQHARHNPHRDDPRRDAPREHADPSRRLIHLPVGPLQHAGASVGGFVNVEGTATMEFDLDLARG